MSSLYGEMEKSHKTRGIKVNIPAVPSLKNGAEWDFLR